MSHSTVKGPIWPVLACQSMIMSLGRLNNLSEDVKQKKISESFEHMNLVQREQRHYHGVIEEFKQALPH